MYFLSMPKISFLKKYAKLFIGMNNISNEVSQKLQQIGLDNDETRIYVELLKGPNTHLKLSRATGINRTKVYRIIDNLYKQSLVTRRTDDRGTFLVASDPRTLEIKLVEQEEKIKSQRQAMKNILPDLLVLQQQNEESFFVQAYEGQAGLKQMCWHELKCQGQLLALGNGTIEQLVSDTKCAQRHRIAQKEAGYCSLEITNYDYNQKETANFCDNILIKSHQYEHRKISPKIIEFDGQTIIYNNTVAIYHWKHDKRVGVEIISKTYARMMRQLFYNYWNHAK